MSLEAKTSKKRAPEAQTSEKKLCYWLWSDDIHQMFFVMSILFIHFLQEANEAGALRLAKSKLEKQLEDLTWRLQLEKRLRVVLFISVVYFGWVIYWFLLKAFGKSVSGNSCCCSAGVKCMLVLQQLHLFKY